MEYLHRRLGAVRQAEQRVLQVHLLSELRHGLRPQPIVRAARWLGCVRGYAPVRLELAYSGVAQHTHEFDMSRYARALARCPRRRTAGRGARSWSAEHGRQEARCVLRLLGV